MQRMAMEVTSRLTPGALCRKSKHEVVAHFRSLIANSQTEDDATDHQLINTALLDLVHTQAIPSEVFTLWLTLAQRRVPSLIKTALEDVQSQGVQKAGVSALRRALRGPQWRTEGWNAVGGVDGLVEIFEKSSVWQAKRVAAVLGRGLLFKGPEGQQLSDEFVQTALSDTKTKATEGDEMRRRPMFPLILPLFYSCSSSLLSTHFIPQLEYPLSSGELKVLKVFHPTSLRELVVQSTLKDPSSINYWIQNSRLELLSSPQKYEPRFISGDSLPSDLTSGLLFCFDLLHTLRSSEKKVDISSFSFLNSIAKGVINEATRRRISFPSVLPLFQLALEVFPQEKSHNLYAEFPKTIVSAWAVSLLPRVKIEEKHCPMLPRAMLSGLSRPGASSREELEQLVVRCIRSVRAPNGRIRPTCPSFIFSIETIPDHARLPFIKIICRNLSWASFDLDHETVLSERLRCRLSWNSALFDSLPAKDSKWLFERLIQLGLRDRIDFKRSNYIRNLRGVTDSNWYENGLLRVKWGSEDPTSHDHPEARKYIDKAKEMAHAERDGPRRAGWVDLTSRFVSRSGSVAICEDHALWARRFIKDAIIRRDLMDSLFYAAHPHILSCVNFPPSRPPSSLATLSGLVERAHSVLDIHLRTFLLIIGEPDFQDNYGPDAASNCLFNITSARIYGLPRLQKFGLGTETQLISVLLDPLIPIILEYERIGIAEDRGGLGSSNLHGPLRFLPYQEPAPPRFAIRFLDKLAKERDELWARERSRRNPAVASLAQGWPKGLPVQNLIPVQWVEAAAADPKNAPYFASRLQDIMFCSANIARQLVPQDTAAIGKCVDSLRFAVDCYVAEPSATEKPVDKVQRVWNHYTSVLPSSLGHLAELRDILLESGKEHQIRGVYKIIGPQVLPNPLPTADPDAGPVEWDPFPDNEDNEVTDEPREKDLTILRCRFAADTGMNISPDSPFEYPTPWNGGPDTTVSDLWQPNIDVRNLPLPTRESLVVSAMLYLDAFAGDCVPLFSEAFPANSKKPRYPAVYLDYDFLDSADNVAASGFTRGGNAERSRGGYRGMVRGGMRRSRHGHRTRRGGGNATRAALTVIQKLKDSIPPQILQKLVGSLLQAFAKLDPSSPKWSAISHVAFKIIGLLARSDTPQVAADQALKVLQDMPNESSWHRQVMSGALTKALSPKQAENMFKSFESIILRSAEGRETSNSQSPRVKITTIKILPQLIGTSSSISPGLSLDILKSLFLNCDHIDIRCAVLDATFNLFETFSAASKDGEAHREIYNTLISFSRFAGAPSERNQVSETQWQDAERGGALPIVHADAPLWDYFLRGVEWTPLERRRAYIDDIILPVLEASTKQHNRWMNILLNRIERDEDEESLTDFGPFRSGLVNEIFHDCRRYLPKPYLSSHREWAMAYRNYSLLQSINEKLMAQDPDWSETDPARQHWNDYLNRHAVVDPVSNLHDSLQSDLEALVQDGITCGDIENEYFTRMQELIREPFDLRSKPPRLYIRALEASFATLASLTWDDTQRYLNIRSLLRKIEQEVESVRASSSPSPKLLPFRFELETALLPFPHLYQASEERYSEFARALCELVDECTQSPFCTADFEYFEKAIGLVKDVDRLGCAAEIGEHAMTKQNTVAGCWYIQLTWKLLQGVWDPSTDDNGDIRRLIDSWKESPVELVRNIAWRAEAGETSASLSR